MASSSVNPPFPLIKPDSPQPASSWNLRAARRDQQRVQDQLNTSVDLSEVCALMEPPVLVAGDVNIARPPALKCHLRQPVVLAVRMVNASLPLQLHLVILHRVGNCLAFALPCA